MHKTPTIPLRHTQLIMYVNVNKRNVSAIKKNLFKNKKSPAELDRLRELAYLESKRKMEDLQRTKARGHFKEVMKDLKQYFEQAKQSARRAQKKIIPSSLSYR
jgi:hypothetical protein